ncbi:hypothetical protein HRbin02_01324 [Candidatus Calditenuaceae archaeon HR02]|nr:hypothetical protein HRbin02_01324 [Candidatus Calditenuaceae archaeon HR02]
MIAENRLKSDRRDSKCLSYIPEGEIARVRELVRRRASLV